MTGQSDAALNRAAALAARPPAFEFLKQTFTRTSS